MFAFYLVSFYWGSVWIHAWLITFLVESVLYNCSFPFDTQLMINLEFDNFFLEWNLRSPGDTFSWLTNTHNHTFFCDKHLVPTGTPLLRHSSLECSNKKSTFQTFSIELECPAGSGELATLSLPAANGRSAHSLPLERGSDLCGYMIFNDTHGFLDLEYKLKKESLYH